MSANLVREQQIASSRNTSARLVTANLPSLDSAHSVDQPGNHIGHGSSAIGWVNERRATSDELRSLGSVRGGKPFLRSQPRDSVGKALKLSTLDATKGKVGGTELLACASSSGASFGSAGPPRRVSRLARFVLGRCGSVRYCIERR